MKKFIVALTILLHIFFIVGCTAPEKEQQISKPTPTIQVSDQELIQGAVHIPKAVFEKPGYIVIHQVVDGDIERIIAHSQLYPEGEHMNIALKLPEENVTGTFAAVQYFDDGDGSYEVPGQDLPITSSGGIIMTQFNVR